MNIWINIIYRHNHETQFYSDMTHEALLDELPINLRSELVTLIYKQNNLDRIAFFQDKPPEFLSQILHMLKRITLEKDDVIFSHGNMADESM